LLTIILCDAFTQNYPTTGKFGYYLWLISFVPFIILAALNIRELLIHNVLKYMPLSFLVLLILLLTLFLGVFDSRNSNFETTQSMHCALNHILGSSDTGYLQTCLFGYPSRQFYVPSLPSLLFGRSLILLNIGTFLMFVVGMIIFYTELLKHFSHVKNVDILIAFLSSLLPHFYFYTTLGFNYE